MFQITPCEEIEPPAIMEKIKVIFKESLRTEITTNASLKLGLYRKWKMIDKKFRPRTDAIQLIKFSVRRSLTPRI